MRTLISLRNALEMNAPRGQIWTLVNIINIREEERKKKKSREIYSGGLTGGRRARASKK